MPLVGACSTFIGHTFDGRNSAFIYVLYSRSERIIYVGQSNGRFGSLGRALQHVAIGGTLRSRAEEELGFPLEDVADLTLLSFRLPELPDLSSVESSYREGLEYLVQKGVNEARLSLGRGFRVISVIRYTDAAGLELLRQIAAEIVEQVISRISAAAIVDYSLVGN